MGPCKQTQLMLRQLLRVSAQSYACSSNYTQIIAYCRLKQLLLLLCTPR